MTAETQLPGGPVPFGSYLLDALIAEGGMARVYRARLRGLGGFEKTLVVKQILPALAREPRFVSMFVEEAKTLVQLGHPHIVPVYELGIVDGVYFLAMEHVEGATLEEIVAAGPLAPALAAHLGAQVADALHYAHGRFGLVHRDVTPRNVLVDAAGHARLVDFGIAAPAEDDGVGAPAFGSPGYMAPEQIRGEAVGPAADVFALGAVLHFAMEGRHAFVRASHAETRHAVLDAPAPALSTDRAPEELRAIVASCLDRDPARRPSSAGELSGKLRAIVAATRPEGVADEIGALADAARRRRAARTDADRRAEPELATPPMTGREPSQSVRTLATSAALEAILRSSQRPPPPASTATRPMPKTTPISEPGRAPSTGDRRAAKSRSFQGALALLAATARGAAGARFLRPPATADERRVPAPAPTTLAAATASESESESATESESASASDSASASASASDSASASTSASASDSATPAPAARATGSLTLHASPWANVALDARPLGPTPRRQEAVAAGTHVLTFECPPLGRSVRRTIRVPPGQSIRVFADLSVDPPRVTVR